MFKWEYNMYDRKRKQSEREMSGVVGVEVADKPS